MDPESDIMGQFLGPETEIMGERYYIFCGVIVIIDSSSWGLKNICGNVIAILRRFNHKVSLAHNVSFWAQKLTHNVSFWGQKLC